MKILVYTSQKGHFLAPELLYGLKEKLGKNVCIYRPRPKDMAVLPNAAEPTSITEVLDDFDALIIHYTAFRDKDFEHVLNRKTNVIKIFLDHFDDFFVRKIYKHPEISYYLKRELYKRTPSLSYLLNWKMRYTYELLFESLQEKSRELFSRWNLPIGVAVNRTYSKLRPYQLTIVPKHIRQGVRKVYDVSFLGHLTSPERSRYVSALKQIGMGLGINCLVLANRKGPNPVSQNEYILKLAMSKAGLSAKGVGYDTVRYWELPAYGSTLISERLPLVIPHDFIDAESALFFGNNEELKQKIKKYVVDSDEWKEIARNGQRQFFRYHTPKKRAEQVLSLVREADK